MEKPMSKHASLRAGFTQDRQPDADLQQQFLEKVLETNLAGILAADSEGRFTYVNRRASEILSRPREAILQSRYDDDTWRITDLDGNPLRSEQLPFARVMATRSDVQGMKHTVGRPDGGYRYVRVNAAPIFANDDRIEQVVISLDDITESHISRKHLELANERFRLAQDATGFGLWEWSPQRDEGSWDEASWQLLGYPASKAATVLRYKDWLQMIHPEDRAVAAAGLQEQIRTGSRFSAEMRYERADGGWQWVQHRGQVTLRTPEGSPLLITGTHTDIQQLKETEQRLNQIANSIHEVFWIRTPEQMLYINAAYERIWGRTREALYADPSDFVEGVHPEDRPRVLAAFAREQDGGAFFDERYRVLRPDGTIRWVHARAYPVEGEPGRTAGTAVDISEAKEAQDELERRASTDALTGLSNRAQFDLKFGDALGRCRRYESPAVLILIDIDHFKDINDTLGHDRGDNVLIEIAARLGSALREVDELSRWGGEEFAVLLPETEIESGAAAAERLRSAVADAAFDGIGQLTVSLGLTALHPLDPDFVTVFRRADSALYHAKRAGRNQVQFLHPGYS